MDLYSAMQLPAPAPLTRIRLSAAAARVRDCPSEDAISIEATMAMRATFAQDFCAVCRFFDAMERIRGPDEGRACRKGNGQCQCEARLAAFCKALWHSWFESTRSANGGDRLLAVW